MSVAAPEAGPANLEFLNDRALTMGTIEQLRENYWMRPGSPFWWSTDYAPDPREFILFDEFQSRLVDVGEGYKLYPEPTVPMTVLDLDIDHLPLRFMVTARPYHPKEQRNGFDLEDYDVPWYIDDEVFIGNFRIPIAQVKSHVAAYGELPTSRTGGTVIPGQCLPHVRGLFVETRGTHLFWSKIFSGRKVENGRRVDFEDKIAEALGRQGLSWIAHHDFRFEFSDRTYKRAHAEAALRKLINTRRPARQEYAWEEVSQPEFRAGWQDRTEGLRMVYPLRLDGFEQTLPLAIGNRTDQDKEISNPVVLGVDAESGIDGRWQRIWRIIDGARAQEISSRLTDDLGMEVDTLMVTPRSGRPKYERVGAY